MNEEDFKKTWTVQEFKNRVWEAVGQRDDTYPLWMLAEFCNHWGQKPGGRKKMLWQLKAYNKSGFFLLSGRLASWKTNSIEWHPKKWEDKNKNPKGIKAKPVKRQYTAQEQEELRLLKERYKKDMNKPRVPTEPKTITKMMLEKVRKQQEYKKQSEQDFTDYEK